MRFRDWKTKADWDEVNADSDLGSISEGARENRERMLEAIRGALMGENLVVMMGSGSSLELNLNEEGHDLERRVVPNMAELWRAVLEKSESTEPGLFQKVLNYVCYKPRKDDENVKSLLSACQISEQFKSIPMVADFIDMAEKALAEKCNFLGDDIDLSAHVSFLRNISRRPAHLPRVQIFTPNYDRCIQAAADQAGFLVVDGFSRSHPHEFDVANYDYDMVRRSTNGGPPEFIPNLFHLYKLHGSIDWERTDSGVIKRDKPDNPLLWYSNRERKNAALEAPFLDLMARFQYALRQPKTALLVIGFGFNDHHIAKPILDAVRFNTSLNLMLANREFHFESNDYHQSLKRLTASGDTRIRFVEANFRELVRLLPEIPLTTPTALPRSQAA